MSDINNKLLDALHAALMQLEHTNQNTTIRDMQHTKDTLRAAMDTFTLPDIRLKLDKDYTIIGCEAITESGAFFLLHNAIIEKNYDSVSFPDLWIETNSPDED